MIRPSSRRPAIIAFVACLLIQAAWILAMPPFRGIDEFDHAYRADAVAHGHWAASSVKPEDGQGGLVPVRASIVEAAERVCFFYSYTGPDNCRAAERLEDGLVLVGSGASSYHPAFYWVIGTPALVAEGSAALLVMRATAALLCALFLAGAVYLLTIGFSSRWPRLALVAGLTPVFVYSTSLAAPNGLEMAAGATVWAALLALGSDELAESDQRTVLGWLTPAAVVLVTLRQLGPLWLLLIVATCLVLYGPARYLRVVRAHPGWTGTAFVLTCAAAAASVVWILDVDALPSSSTFVVRDRLGVTLSAVPLWLLQSIAAFPTRNEPAPMAVYAPYLVLGLAMLVVAWLAGSRALRRALAVLVVLSLVVPAAITYATLDAQTPGWQGRYALPYTVGFALLFGLAMASARHRRLERPAIAVALLCVTYAQATSVLFIQRKELTNDASVATPLWPLVDEWVLLALVLASAVLAATAGLMPAPRASPAADEHDAEAVDLVTR